MFNPLGAGHCAELRVIKVKDIDIKSNFFILIRFFQMYKILKEYIVFTYVLYRK